MMIFSSLIGDGDERVTKIKARMALMRGDVV